MNNNSGWQDKGGPLAVTISVAGGVKAELGAFGSINGVESDALAADLDGVTINDRSGTLNHWRALGAHDTGEKSACQ
ncbi:hypothetical protein [Aestuariivirga sp.]|jgi:hypothetical protein|uniref:hypothetical protein n=1 Tax=Aestuariivirga sp. TaxID=2650926 RepID=UPI0037841686